MKSILSLFLLFNLLTNQISTGDNIVKGKISFPEISESFIQQGANYGKNAAALSEEKIRIDQLNDPTLNVYISLHPQNFEAELTQTNDVRITQREKTFFPNMVAVTKGSTVKFVNEDEHYHNVYSLTPKARFNIGRRPTGNVYGQKINKVGVIKLGCDIHDDMGATILSLDTPYFTKIKEDGTFILTDLPDGRYMIKVYHPKLEKYSEQLLLEGGVVVEKNIKLLNKA